MKPTCQQEKTFVADSEAPLVTPDSRHGRRGDGKRIALFGYYGVGSYGNDWTLEATVDFFRQSVPEEKLICICPNPGLIAESLGIDAIVIAHGSRPSDSSRTVARLKKALGKSISVFHAFWQLRKVKLLMLAGGGGLCDFQAHPLGWPYDFMVWTVIARLMGIKVIYAGVGAGPIYHPVSRIFLKLAGRAAHFRSYREQSTRQFMADFGFDVSEDRVYPDLVFRLPAPAEASSGESPLTVCIGLMTYFGRWTVSARGREFYKRYQTKMLSYVGWLLDQGYRVRFFLGDDSDRQAVHDLLDAVRRAYSDRPVNSVVYEPETSLDGVLRQLGHADLVVATRFHNVVCALKMRKPTISISYHIKNDDLMARAGVGDYCQHIDDFDLRVLKEHTRALLADQAAITRGIGVACAHFEDELHDLENTILSLIPDRASA